MATRGRPKLYTGVKFAKIVEMISEHGALKTTKILRSRADAEIASLRDKRVFPNRLSISFPTILRIAKDGGLTLSLGRRPLETAEVPATETVTPIAEPELETVTG